ncbi:HAAS signaling domain-containing protein [Catellatospora vulcania]|uniref:HAAS signaling domain-containing protein n=1 Tax=Catellatospora vulcania TaxID=1460450 RepID=UPI0012D3B16D|nr:hypothetical protein [Catellatospora vulcania]
MNVEIAQYAAQVGAALSDLPEQARDDLLEDLPAHLAEVAAEIEAEGGGATLAERLGPPSAYAAELRATLGHPGRPGRAGVWVGRAVSRAQVRWNGLDRRLGPVIGYERLGEFLALLRPAWWVVRGWLVAMLVAQLWRDGDGLGLLPRFEGSTVLGMMVLIAFVVGSIWLGRRTAAAPPTRRRERVALRAATAVVVVFGLGLWAAADDRLMGPFWQDPSAASWAPDPYQQVNDVFVLGPDGQIIEGARLVDQDGSPVVLGYCAQRFGWEGPGGGGRGWEWRVVYPSCPDLSAPQLPWVAASPGPLPWQTPTGPSPSPSTSGSPSPGVAAATPSATPTPKPSPAS